MSRFNSECPKFTQQNMPRQGPKDRMYKHNEVNYDPFQGTKPPEKEYVSQATNYQDRPGKG